MMFFRKLCSTAVKSKEVNCFIGHINRLKYELEKCILSKDMDGDDRKSFAGLIEAISLLYLGLILETGKAYQELDFDKKALEIIKSIDAGFSAEKNEFVRGKQEIDFYRKIITEVNVEGRRITPDWVIKQQIAKEEYVYLNSLLDNIREGINNIFCLGKVLSDKELYFEACIIFIKFYEYESKLARLIKVVEFRKEELKGFQIDKEFQWDEFRLEKLLNSINEWKKTVPALLSKCSIQFVTDNWNDREEYPDFLGECYNHICEDAVEAITNGDIEQFKTDYENLSKLMLLYQEYIRTDFLMKKDLFRSEYAYYMFTSPIVEWAQIGGLAILWGEFNSAGEWGKCVNDSSSLIINTDRESTGLAEKLVEYVKLRERFMYGIGNRDLIENGWKQDVVNVIINSGICKTEYDKYGRHLKSDSKLLKAFCPYFWDRGFSDPSEVFWVICVNPYLSKDRKYHSKNSWEDKLND